MRYTEKFDSSKAGYAGYGNLNGIQSPNNHGANSRFASNTNGGESAIVSDGVINLTGYLNTQQLNSYER